MNRARAFDLWRIEPPLPNWTYFREPCAPDLVWRTLLLRSSVPEHGRALFSGTLALRNAHWREFSGLVRQAKTYWDAASAVRGNSAALPHYYCFLNLAKAELVIKAPATVLGKRLNHGLSFSPTRARTLGGDILTVQDGVFPLLYEQRTGYRLPKNTLLPIRRLLLQCQEIGWETEQLGVGSTLPASAVHAYVCDASHTWSVLGLESATDFPATSLDPAGRLFRKHYEEAVLPDDWRETFSMSGRVGASTVDHFFQSRQPVSFVGTDPFHPNFIDPLIAPVRDIVGPPHDDAFDAEIFPGLYKTKSLLMPPDLARYALIYYVSSLVRYKPVQVDPVLSPRGAWLADAIVDQSTLSILKAALSGIEGVNYLFYPPGAFRV